MNRLFKIARRRPRIIDLFTPNVVGTTYRLKWAQNFDGVFATVLTCTNTGFLDPAVNQNVLDVPSAPGQVRIVFDPVSYSIDDTKSFWLQFFPLIGGVEQTPGAPTLILPDSMNKGVGVVTLRGTAPNGAASANSLQLDLPFLMSDIRVYNEEGTTGLFVSTEAGGPETKFEGGVKSPQTLSLYGTQGSLWVRGGGATAVFSATCTAAFPR